MATAQIREIQKKYCSRALMLAIIAFFGLYLAGQVAMGKGLLLGTLFSVVNFVLMGETLPTRLAPTKRRRITAALGSMGMRFALMAVPIVLAIRLDTYNLATVMIGLFSVQGVLLADGVLRRRTWPEQFSESE